MQEFAYQERHMGTDMVLSFICPDKRVADTIATDVYTQIHKYELRFSRFLPESELSQLNVKRTLKVSDTFLEVLTRSLELTQLTNLAFNPLTQVAKLGYRDTYKKLANQTTDVVKGTYNTDIEEISINLDTQTVALAPGQMLDFGGILKGYLSQKLADHVNKTYPVCTGLIINLGGDLSTRGTDELHEPFIFMLYNPVSGEEIPLALTDTSLTTSGTYARMWQTNVGPQHHIVDSKSQQNPITGLTAVSITHSDGALAEALTKLFLVTGIESATNTLPVNDYHYKYFTVSTSGEIISNTNDV